MSRSKPLLCALALFGLASQAEAASTLRCGSQLISVGDNSYEVGNKCGQPVAVIDRGYKRSANRREEYKVEDWVYGPNGGMTQYLRFEGGQLIRIDSRRGN